MLKLMTAHSSWLPAFVLVSFVALFGFIIWFVVTDRRKGHYEHMGNLPNDD